LKIAVSKLHAEEMHIDTARLWFDSAVKSNPDYGESWVYYYKLEKQFGDDVFMNFIIIDFLNFDFY